MFLFSSIKCHSRCCQYKPGRQLEWSPLKDKHIETAGRTKHRPPKVDIRIFGVFGFYDDLSTCPDNLLLFFHHLPWSYKMRSGRTLWEEMCHVYTDGLNDVRRFQKVWDLQESKIDPGRFKAVQYKLREQLRDAIWWRDGVLLYFQSVNGLPIPYELERPMNKLEDLMQYRLRMGNSSLPPGIEPPQQQISPINPGPQPRQNPQ